MKTMLTIAGGLAFAATTAFAQEPELFHLSVKDVPVENGKVLDMEFHEIERTPDASTVEVLRRSGGSVSSSMFVLRGMCGLARSRNARYFVPVRGGAGGSMRFRLSFPQEAPAPGQGFTMAQCELLRY